MAKVALEALPDSDKSIVEGIRGLVIELDDFFKLIEKDIELYEMCKSHKDLGKFKDVTARDAVMNVFHVFDIIKGISVKISKSTNIEKIVDKNSIDSAISMFMEKFPDYRDLRNAIAHSGEMAVKPSQRYSKSGEVGGFKLWEGDKFRVTNGFLNDHFFFTRKGRTVSLEICKETYNKLELVRAKLLGGLGKI